MTNGYYEAFPYNGEHEELDLTAADSVKPQAGFNKMVAYIVKCFPEALGIRCTA